MQVGRYGVRDPFSERVDKCEDGSDIGVEEAGGGECGTMLIGTGRMGGSWWLEVDGWQSSVLKYCLHVKGLISSTLGRATA